MFLSWGGCHEEEGRVGTVGYSRVYNVYFSLFFSRGARCIIFLLTFLSHIAKMFHIIGHDNQL